MREIPGRVTAKTTVMVEVRSRVAWPKRFRVRERDASGGIG